MLPLKTFISQLCKLHKTLHVCHMSLFHKLHSSAEILKILSLRADVRYCLFLPSFFFLLSVSLLFEKVVKIPISSKSSDPARLVNFNGCL
jgi:hypothetical protein